MSNTSRVAAVLDRYSVILNRGSEHDVRIGDIYTIGDGIIDPETGENLGSYSKLRVKVTEVYPKFCVAETYKIVLHQEPAVITVSVGDQAQLSEWARPGSRVICRDMQDN